MDKFYVLKLMLPEVANSPGQFDTAMKRHRTGFFVADAFSGLALTGISH